MRGKTAAGGISGVATAAREVFEPMPESPMFLCQNPRHQGQRLGYKELHKRVKRLGAIAGVEHLHPHRFRYSFGTEVTKRGVDPLFSKELMGIKSDRVFQQAAARAYPEVIGEDDEN